MNVMGYGEKVRSQEWESNGWFADMTVFDDGTTRVMIWHASGERQFGFRFPTNELRDFMNDVHRTDFTFKGKRG